MFPSLLWPDCLLLIAEVIGSNPIGRAIKGFQHIIPFDSHRFPLVELKSLLIHSWPLLETAQIPEKISRDTCVTNPWQNFLNGFLNRVILTFTLKRYRPKLSQISSLIRRMLQIVVVRLVPGIVIRPWSLILNNVQVCVCCLRLMCQHHFNDLRFSFEAASTFTLQRILRARLIRLSIFISQSKDT